MRKEKGRRVELEDGERSERVVNSESLTLLQSGNAGRSGWLIDGREDFKEGGHSLDALFGTVAWGHSGVVEGLSPFPSALPHLPPPREP